MKTTERGVVGRRRMNERKMPQPRRLFVKEGLIQTHAPLRVRQVKTIMDVWQSTTGLPPPIGRWSFGGQGFQRKNEIRSNIYYCI
eukprot:scaffold267_cov192-Amphora_coffeaeformis.AAC.16